MNESMEEIPKNRKIYLAHLYYLLIINIDIP